MFNIKETFKKDDNSDFVVLVSNYIMCKLLKS